MTEQRLTEQLQLVFTSTEDVQSSAVGGGAESVVAKREPERPAVTTSVMEAVCERENLKKALRRVKANKGSPGVDGMTVEQLPDYLRAHWLQHRDELLRGTYTPSPVRRVEIPKPDGGVRKFGVPTVAAYCIRVQQRFGLAADHPSLPSARRRTSRHSLRTNV